VIKNVKEYCEQKRVCLNLFLFLRGHKAYDVDELVSIISLAFSTVSFHFSLNIFYSFPYNLVQVLDSLMGCDLGNIWGAKAERQTSEKSVTEN
jgi:hypothetical protein